MILSFSQKWPASMGEWAGQPTFFVDKIWLGLAGNGIPEMDIAQHYYETTFFKKFGGNLLSDPIKVSPVPVCCGEVAGEPKFITWDYLKPKLHTMRHDPHNKWFAGRDIQFAINPRSKNYFQFAPTMPCVSIQYIEIKWELDCPSIYIANNPDFSDKGLFYYSDPEGTQGRAQMEVFANNDGFDSVDHFFNWFNAPMRYKLIHWTDLRY